MEHNIVCDVCLEEDDAEGDEIVICELCLGAVHQSCYGGDIQHRLPRDDVPWYCARCEVLIKEKKACNEIKCFLCPDLDGILKPVDAAKKKWAHIICVNWTPEVWFVDDAKSRICGEVPEARMRVTCQKCNSRNGSII